MKKVRRIMFVTMLAIMILLPSLAFASGNGFLDGLEWDSKNVSNNLKNDANKIISYVRFGAGVWTLIWLFFAAMMLQASGSNPQRRNAAIVCLILVIAGAYVAINAKSVIGWFS